MKVMLLVRVLDDAQPTDEEADPTAWDDDATRRGLLHDRHRLQDPPDATTVRVRDGKTLITDGPFAEFKEYVAGFGLLEVADLEEAVALAAQHPAARFGAIELREVWDFPERADGPAAPPDQRVDADADR